MNTITLKQNLFLFVFSLSSVSLVNGQKDFTILPFKIDIKKNVSNIKALNLSDIASEILYIPLETNPDCMIDKINHIELSSSYIFVNDVNRLLQFDKTGKFIRQIGRQGRGPEEYVNINNFCINEIENEIYILTYDKVLIFDLNGRFIRTLKLSFRPSQIILIDHNNLMYHLPNISGPKYYNSSSWIITDLQGMIIRRFRNNLLRISQPGLVIPRTPLYTYDNTVYCMEFGIDTLFYLQSSAKIPYAIMNFENLKMDPDPLLTPETLEKTGEKLFEKLWINYIHENNDFLFIKFFQGLTDSVRCALYNKKRGDLNFLKENAFLNDLDGGIMFWPEQVINDNILVDYIDGFEFLKNIAKIQSSPSNNQKNKISPKLLNLTKSLTATSNPVIMIVKSKL